MSLPAYPEYKDSGIEWLGQVPSHWEVKKLKNLSNGEPWSFIDGDWIESPYITDEGVRLLQTGNIGIGCFKEQGYRFVSEETFRQLKCTEVRPGDILVCRLADPVGRACLAPELGVKMITSVDVTILKPAAETHPAFIVYFLSSTVYLSYMESTCRGGTRDRVARSFLGSTSIPLPPLNEQQAIAAWLDERTGRIDEAVAEQRTLLEQLKEKRRALIAHAVTRGLDPAAPLKDSGIEWLGLVPAHWNVCALGYRYEVALGKMLDEKRITGKHLAPYLRNADVQWGRINTEGLNEMDFLDEEQARYRLQNGDLLVCEGGEVGRCALWANQIEECYYQKALHRLRAHAATVDTAAYFQHVLYSAVNLGCFAADENKATIAHLTAEQLRAHRFPFPPLHEQQAIAAYLDTETAKLDTLTAETEATIALLQEHRTALIAEAVTGKIRVPGA